jgi:hypothetical protein
MQALDAVQTVDAVLKAKQRIAIKTNLTFYSKNDLWYYFTVTVDNSLCEVCLKYDGKILLGSSLRSEFPFHTVDDENIIKPHVHPNCRCFLVRAVDIPLEAQEIFEE